MRKHVDDEALLDRLLHRVGMERQVLSVAAFLNGCAEDLQGLVLWGGRESEVAGVAQHLPGFHQTVDDVLGSLFLLRCGGLAQRHRHGSGGAPALAGMGFVNDNGELAPPVLATDGVKNEGELLDGADDDALAFLEQGTEMAGALGHGRRPSRPERTA